ncbi:hypothetical protein HK102_010722, partial [Quaeritorhiza haematococci]
VPTKGNGGIWFAPYLNSTLGPLTNIIKNRQGYFYHSALAIDVNNDGHLDILSCRAKKPLIGGTDGRMVWLEPKDRSKPLAAPWVERELAKVGCDVYMEVVDVDGDGRRAVFTTDFFTEKTISVFYSDDPKDDLSNLKLLKRKVIDASVGNPFDIHATDLNNDGHLELLVTNHEAKGATNPSASVFAYEIPTNWRSSFDTPEALRTDVSKQPLWKRHTLLSDIPVRQGGLAPQAAPGSAKAFFPSDARRGKKPSIMVSGDGSQRAYILNPKTEDVGDWEYEVNEFHDCGGNSVVGGIAVDDVDGDGFAEVFVPCYDADNVAVFTFAPQQ